MRKEENCNTQGGVYLCPTVSGIVACLPAPKTSPFSHAFSMFLGGEFLESYSVDIHSIWVRRDLGCRSVQGPKVGVLCSSSQLVNA